MRSTDEVNEMVMRFRPLADKLAGKMWHRGTMRELGDYEDCLQEALYGLILGAKRFDPSKGIKPITFLYACIWKRLLDRSQRVHAIHIPAYIMSTPRAARTPESNALIENALVRFSLDTLPDDSPAHCSRPAFADRLVADRLDVLDAIRHLTAQERFVVMRKFGINGTVHNSVEIAKELGLTKQRVAQIWHSAEEKLRRVLSK